MKRVIVIGAGASGMLAAISAARSGASVTLLEGKEKPGKKLMITGSGRCNLTNLAMNVENAYHKKDTSFIQAVLQQFPVEDTIAFFEEIGLKTCDRDGYVYPVTGQAKSVLNVLLLELQRLHVKVKCSEKVLSLKREHNVWKASTEGWTYEADAVILSAGSKAAPSTGSDGSGYSLAASLGHFIVKPLPALVPMKVSDHEIKKLAGVRMPVCISMLTENGLRTETGELQWTDYGISGIAVFQLSAAAARKLDQKEKVSVTLDLLPFLTEESFFDWALEYGKGRSLGELFAGFLPEKAIPVLLSMVKVPAKKENLRKIVYRLKHFELDITGVKGFEQAQVCSGGVDLKEVQAETLESKRCPGLYFTGELLDVDGICGGFNLQWAWSSGWTAGLHASKGDGLL